MTKKISGKTAKEKRRRGPGCPWPKGVSGNPKGRPPTPPELKEAARKLTIEGMNILANIIRNGESERARIDAIKLVIERGFGKPTQGIAFDDVDGPTEIRVRWVSRGTKGDDEEK